MKNIVLLVFLIFIGVNSYAQPNIPIENIPDNISADIRENINLLYSQNTKTRIDAIRNLARMGKKAFPAIPFLTAILGDRASVEEDDQKGEPNSISCEGAAYGALLTICSSCPEAIDIVVDGLKNKDSAVRTSIAYLMIDMKNIRALKPLIESLDDENAKVRQYAACALGQIKNKQAIQSLIACLSDEIYEVQFEAAGALANIKYQAIEPLLRVLKKDGGKPAWWASEILSSITGNDFGQDYVKWNKWWKNNGGIDALAISKQVIKLEN